MSINVRTQHKPPACGPEIWLKRLRTNEIFECQVWSPSIWGHWTHWYGKHSEPCIEPREICPGCKRNVPAKWKGYVLVCPLGKGQRLWFLELTKWSARCITSQVREDASLRGLHFKCSRGNGKNTRVNIAVEPAHDHDPVPGADISPLTTLETLWKQQGVSLHIYDPAELDQRYVS